MTRKVVLVNGPPRAGKDEVGKAILNGPSEWNVSLYKMTTPMDRALPVLFGVSYTRWPELREKLKDTPVPDFFGGTCRQALINLSEEFMKPLCGPDVFGKLAVKHMSQEGLVVITDAGFRHEALPIIEHFGKENVLYVRLERWSDGKMIQFTDSRSYYDLADTGVKRVTLVNDADLPTLCHRARALVNRWLSGND